MSLKNISKISKLKYYELIVLLSSLSISIASHGLLHYTLSKGKLNDIDNILPF